MTRLKAISAGILGVLAGLSAAQAASSPWFVTEGGQIRLIAAESKPGEPILKGALQVALKPGWKTYWRDPGSSGVPPQVDASSTPGISGVQIGFPPPRRFDDAYGSWIGYNDSTTFALTFSLDGKTSPSQIDAGVFLGICHDICIPVQANFSVMLNTDMSEPGTDGIIEEAFAALPRAPQADFGVSGVALNEQNVVVNAVIPVSDGRAELFVENAGGWYFGKPEPVSSAGGIIRFSVPVIEKPNGTQEPVSVPYTLVTSSGAVAGKMSFGPTVE